MGAGPVQRDLTVITFKWHGWRDRYDHRNVNALHRMLQAHLHYPHRMVCVTDEPDGIECETFPAWEDPIVPSAPTHHGSWRRLKLMSDWAARQWPGWILVLDLDVLIVDDITPLITWDDLRILKGAVSRYRGGMWLHRTGTRTHVWDSFDPVTSPWEIPKYKTKGRPWVGSDQGWISVTCPGERTYTPRDGVYAMSSTSPAIRADLPSDARVVFPMGDVKPWSPEARDIMPAMHAEYRQWLKESELD